MEFDIIIPTWNNLPYLKLAIESIKKYSTYNHSIYVHVNEGIDGTIEWLNDNGINYTHFKNNKGVCEGTNLAAKLGNNSIVTYFNDDMVALPGWDIEIVNFINSLNDDKFMLCSTPIEPIGNNINCIIKNYGIDVQSFNIDNILNDLPELKLQKSNMVSTWSPLFIPRKLWDDVGGYSIEFEPGFGSDPDLCKKLYDVGCKNFIGVGKSLIYHFQSKTTKKTKTNNSRLIFKEKHGIDLDYFINEILKRGKTI